MMKQVREVFLQAVVLAMIGLFFFFPLITTLFFDSRVRYSKKFASFVLGFGN